MPAVSASVNSSSIPDPAVLATPAVDVSSLSVAHKATRDSATQLFAAAIEAVKAFVSQMNPWATALILPALLTLSLMVPLLSRGLNKKLTATKRRVAVITDNMAKLVDSAVTVRPFIPKLLPGLIKIETSVGDPEARGVVGKAIATLRQIGEVPANSDGSNLPLTKAAEPTSLASGLVAVYKNQGANPLPVIANVSRLTGLTTYTSIIISHDLSSLNNVITDVLHLNRFKLRRYHGNLEYFMQVVPEAESYYTLQAVEDYRRSRVEEDEEEGHRGVALFTLSCFPRLLCSLGLPSTSLLSRSSLTFSALSLSQLLPSNMSSVVDPSTLGLDPHSLSKLSKKDLAKHMSTLQGMYVERGRKYDKAKSIIRSNKAAIQAKSANEGLIPKPYGHRSRDFNIYEEMKHNGKVNLTQDTYNNLISYIHRGVIASNINMRLPYTAQDMTEIVKVIAFAKEEYPFIREYKNAWPVTMLMAQYLDNHRAYLHAKATVDEPAPADAGGTTAGPSIATPGPDHEDPDDDGHQGEGQTDVTVSDIEDDDD